LAQLSLGYPRPEDRSPTCYAPVRRCTQAPKRPFSLDLHVLGTPPAFALSQDQTLHLNLTQGSSPWSCLLHWFRVLSACFLSKLSLRLFSFQRAFRSPRRSWYRESPPHCQGRKFFSLPRFFRLYSGIPRELCSSLILINNVRLERKNSHYKNLHSLVK